MSMIDVWLDMFDAMLIARYMISVCGSWMTKVQAKERLSIQVSHLEGKIFQVIPSLY